jgi:hypothetical protein
MGFTYRQTITKTLLKYVLDEKPRNITGNHTGAVVAFIRVCSLKCDHGPAKAVFNAHSWQYESPLEGNLLKIENGVIKNHCATTAIEL